MYLSAWSSLGPQGRMLLAALQARPTPPKNKRVLLKSKSIHLSGVHTPSIHIKGQSTFLFSLNDPVPAKRSSDISVELNGSNRH